MSERIRKTTAPQRAYVGVSQWHNSPIIVEYDENTHQVNVHQGPIYFAYPIQAWMELVRAVSLVLPEPLSALASTAAGLTAAEVTA